MALPIVSSTDGDGDDGKTGCISHTCARSGDNGALMLPVYTYTTIDDTFGACGVGLHDGIESQNLLA